MKFITNKEKIDLKINLIKENNIIKIEVKKDSGKPYSILLFNINGIKDVKGGKLEKTEKGTKIIPEKKIREIIIEL